MIQALHPGLAPALQGARGRGGKHGRVIERQLRHAQVGLPPLDGVGAGVPVVADVQVLGEGEVRTAHTGGCGILAHCSVNVREAWERLR